MFACIYIPDFPVEAMVRAEPLLRERAIAVLEGKPPLVRVIALNERARLLGIEAGMTKLQAAVFAEPSEPEATAGEKDLQPRKSGAAARSNRFAPYSPSVAILRQRSPEQESSSHAAMLDVAHAFTPRVEDSAPDTLLLELGGMERLYGAPAKMARELASRVGAIGLEANVALAANPNAALHAARGFNGTTVIPAGSEGKRLGVLPLRILLDAFDISSEKKTGGKNAEREREKMREQMLDTLERWGVRDFRTLALLPEHALASRLGATGGQLRHLACGAGMRVLALCDAPAQFEEAMELESAVESLEPLAFILNRLLEQLCARLEARALAVQELQLRLQLEPRAADEATTTVHELHRSSLESHNVRSKPVFVRSLRLPVSMRDPKVFLKLLQLELAAHPPGAPVTKVWIMGVPAPPRSAQRGLFLPITPEAEKLEISLARISSIVGERRAGIVRLLDRHRRDSFQIDRFVTTVEDQKQTSPQTLSDTGMPPLAMRIFRPARRLEVRWMEGRPASLSAEERQRDQEKLQGKIVWSAGPWRSSGDWWTENAKEEAISPEQGAWDREEWDVALAQEKDNGADGNGNVALYRIYRDLASGRWFADASYD
jgi:protein ImuB